MPLYEIVLDYEEAGAGQEVRLTDRPVALGDTIEIDWVDWVVVRRLAGSAGSTARFRCVRTRAEPRVEGPRVFGRRP